MNWDVAYPYIPSRFEEELKGIAECSNGVIDYMSLRRINMMPELTRAACTIVGAHGVATQDQTLLHLRALDWSPDAPVNRYPSIIIYEPSEANSNVFANIGYLGLIGSLTGMSKNGISVGEKVMYVSDPTDYDVKPKTTYHGEPWLFVLRDTIQFAKNMHDVETNLLNSQRTMKIHLGFGSLPDATFRGVDYAANFVNFYDDKNYTHYSDAHPQLDHVFYYDKHVQPSGDYCVGNILKANHGMITAETLYADIPGFHKTGNA